MELLALIHESISACFLAAALVQIRRLSKREKGERAVEGLREGSRYGVALYVAKMASALALASASLADWAMLWPQRAGRGAAAIVALPLIHLEHFALPASSFIVTSWILTTLLTFLYEPRVDEITNLPAWRDLPLVQIAIVARLVLLIFDNINKRSLLIAKSVTPCYTAPPLSRASMFWLLGLFSRGLRSPLSLQDLPKEPDMQVDELYDRFERVWEDEKERMSLLRALCKAFARELLAPIFPGVVSAVAVIAQPYLLYRLVAYLASETKDTYEARIIAVSFALSGIIYLVLNAVSATTVAKAETIICTVLYQIILRKATSCDAAAAREHGNGLAVSLIAVDTDRIRLTLRMCYFNTYSVVVVCLVGFALVQIVAGWMSCLLVIIILLGGTTLTPFAVPNYVKRQDEWSKCSDRRTDLSTSVVRHLKAVVMSGYSAAVAGLIDDLRKGEYTAYENFYWLDARLVSVSNVIAPLVPVVQFFYIALSHNAASSASIFGVLGVISTIAWPVTCASQLGGRIPGALAALRRIEDFKRSPDHPPRAVAETPQDIALDCASFGWDWPILSELSLSIVGNGLTLVLGAVGSGKSSLLHALLGEMPCLDGNFQLLPTGEAIAFASQMPWLQASSLSIRDNIVFAAAFNQQWYELVIKAVALDYDLEMLPLGDSQLAKGLSGGQAQRVGLARALYASKNADLVLLDDPFSAIDAVTERHCWHSLFGVDGLLVGKTTIMTTNNLHRLVDADCLVLLEAGCLAAHGEAKHQLESDGPIKQLYDAFVQQKRHSSAVVEDRALVDKGDLAIGGDDIEDELSRTDAVPRRSLWRFLGLMWSWHGLALLLTLGGAQTVGYVSPMPGIIAQRFAAAGEDERMRWAGVMAGWLAVMCSVLSVGRLEQPMAMAVGTKRLERKAVWSMLHARFPAVAAWPSGVLAQRMSSDTFIIKDPLSVSLGNMLARTAELLARVVFVAFIAPQALWGFAFFVVSAFEFQALYSRVIVRLRALRQASTSSIFGLFGEIIDTDGLRTNRALDAQQMVIERSNFLVDRAQPANLAQTQFEFLLVLAVSLFSSVVETAVVVVLLYSGSGGSFSAVAALAILGMAGQMSHFVRNVVDARINLNSVGRLLELTDLPQHASGNDSLDASQDLVFQDVSLRYSVDAPLALDGFSLTIKPGESIGISGRTGSGKSSLLQALAALYPLERGQILVGGQNIDHVDPQALRRAITIVPQEPFLLATTIRNNIDPSASFTDAQIWSALDKASCGQIVRKLEGGLDHLCIGQEGALSRGELQCLALARAILRQSGIIALDEASASIDMASERALQQAINLAGVTKLIVAHRLSTIMRCNRVVVMERGRIVELGEPSELLKTEGGALRALAGEQEGDM